MSKNSSFYNKIKKMLEKESPKNISLTCNSFWCKGRFEIREDIYSQNPGAYRYCKKCSKDFNTGKVIDNGLKEYEGTRRDPNNWDKYTEGKIEFNNLRNKY